MRIIAFGDVHLQLGNFRNIPGINSADLILITGDFTNYGNRPDAKKIIEAIMPVNKNTLALPGNLDKKDVADYLVEQGVSLHGSGRIINNIGLFGVGGSNRTPFHTPLEFNEKELATLAAAGHQLVLDATFHILVSHPPPFRTKTDKIASGSHVGSSAIRAFIEQTQPDLCICGHIHEAMARDRIGRTMIFNPGMIKNGGWVEVIMENNALEAHLQAL